MATGRTTNYLIPYPLQSDPVDVAEDVKQLADLVDSTLYLKSNISSPVFTGTPQSTTAVVDTNTTQIATTAFVLNQSYLKSATASSTYAPLLSPSLTGVPLSTTAPVDTNTTQIATTGFVIGQGYAKSADVASVYASKEYINTVYVNYQTGSYTIALTDVGKVIEIDSLVTTDLVVPLDIAVNFPIGSTIDFIQIGSGKVTVLPYSGVTVQAKNEAMSLSGQFAAGTMYKRAADTWIIMGDLVA